MNEAPQFLYKILTQTQWQKMQQRGIEARYGSPLDKKDGFLHTSTARQVERVAKKFFDDMTDGVLIQLNYAKLSPIAKWEPASNGELYAHFYEALSFEAVDEVMDFDSSHFDYDNLVY